MTDLIWTIRKLIRNRHVGLIHIISLMAGVCGFLFIFTYCYHQLSYDTYHGDTSALFRVNSAWVSDTDESMMTITPGTISADLKQNYPFVKAAGYVSLIDHNPQITHQSHIIETEDFYSADHDILNVFRFDFICGNKNNALSQPKQLILNETYALKVFGHTDCIGDLIEIQEKSFEVIGVFKNWPSNVDFNINGLFTNENVPSKNDQFAFRTFVKLEGVQKEPHLNKVLEELAEAYYKNDKEAKSSIYFRPQSFKGLHFEKSLLADSPKGNINFVYIYLLTGLILFVIVLTNQINLNFVRNADLVKTNGITRILGGSKWRVKYQNLLENSLLLSIGVGLSLLLFQVILKNGTKVNDFLLTDLLEHPWVIALIITFYFIITWTVSLLTTSVSLNKDLSLALKKQLTHNLPSAKFRNYLVLFQYTVCLVLVSALVVLHNQWDYIKGKDLGFNSDNIHVVDVVSVSREDKNKLLLELSDLFGYENVSTTPVDGTDVTFSTLSFPNKERFNLNVSTINADATFFNIMGIQLILGVLPAPAKGFNFDNGHRMPVVINETLARSIPNPIGTNVNVDGWFKGRIAGIIKDFHYKSLHNAIEPLVIFPSHSGFKPGPGNKASFAIRSTKEEVDISNLTAEVLPSNQFQIQSASNKMLENYEQEKQAMKLLGLFSGVSVFVALLGISGLLIYTMKKRKFEIGIRKVLGAQLSSLIILFGKKILKLIGIAVVISFPLILLLKDKFLSLYAFSTEVDWLTLLIPGLLVATITILLILGLVRYSSKVNPVELIRDE
ncbi:MAG: ABC transporter permease [Reichenbachiella sp.]|uniref:ABC transporter permease n=1 Tax=Reichenbachiella sp. TaxID=2184521 RepID=UPI003263EE47